jgi:hypothetical protein
MKSEGPRFNGYDPKSNSNRPFTNSPKTVVSNSFPHEEKRSVDARVTYLTEYELMNGKPGEVEVVRSGKKITQLKSIAFSVYINVLLQRQNVLVTLCTRYIFF